MEGLIIDAAAGGPPGFHVHSYMNVRHPMLHAPDTIYRPLRRSAKAMLYQLNLQNTALHAAEYSVQTQFFTFIAIIACCESGYPNNFKFRTGAALGSLTEPIKRATVVCAEDRGISQWTDTTRSWWIEDQVFCRPATKFDQIATNTHPGRVRWYIVCIWKEDLELRWRTIIGVRPCNDSAVRTGATRFRGVDALTHTVAMRRGHGADRADLVASDIARAEGGDWKSVSVGWI